MRIGIDARMYTSAFTGIGRYVFELINHLLLADPVNKYAVFMNRPAYDEYQFPQRNIEKILVDAPIYSLAEQTSILKKLWAAKLDLMHFTHFNAPIFYRRPSVVTIHDLTISFYPGKKRIRLIDRAAYRWAVSSIMRRAKKIIAVSNHTKQDILKLFPNSSGKITVIHEGVNELFHPINNQQLLNGLRTRIGVKEPFLLYTGNWRDHKNLVNLIKAFGILKRKYHLPHFLVITGKDDPWYPEVKQTVKGEKLEGMVRFTGIVPDEDLVLLYNAADIYVFPSFYEGFGLPALEAFACGVPVCAADAASLPEICGDAAAYFDPKYPEDIGRAILEVFHNRDLRKNLIEKGFQRVQLFSWKKMAQETLNLYKDVYTHC